MTTERSTGESAPGGRAGARDIEPVYLEADQPRRRPPTGPRSQARALRALYGKQAHAARQSARESRRLASMLKAPQYTELRERTLAHADDLERLADRLAAMRPPAPPRRVRSGIPTRAALTDALGAADALRAVGGFTPEQIDAVVGAAAALRARRRR
jgi:hypothetical protein